MKILVEGLAQAAYAYLLGVLIGGAFGLAVRYVVPDPPGMYLADR